MTRPVASNAIKTKATMAIVGMPEEGDLDVIENQYLPA